MTSFLLLFSNVTRKMALFFSLILFSSLASAAEQVVPKVYQIGRSTDYMVIFEETSFRGPLFYRYSASTGEVEEYEYDSKKVDTFLDGGSKVYYLQGEYAVKYEVAGLTDPAASVTLFGPPNDPAAEIGWLLESNRPRFNLRPIEPPKLSECQSIISNTTYSVEARIQQLMNEI